jgi:gas vesicle protein
MRCDLTKILKFAVAAIGPDLRRLQRTNVLLLHKINQLEDLIMGTKTALQEMAEQIAQVRAEIAGSVENIAKDIENLTGQLVDAATPDDVKTILQPQIDALKALAEAAKKTADVVPDKPAEPGPGEL